MLVVSDTSPITSVLTIDLSDVSYTWRDDDGAVLDHLSMQIPAGSRTFVQGASGSGKTTLLSLLAGIITPQQGEISILGQRLDRMTGAQRDHFRAQHIGYIFQMFNLVPYLSVIENVTLPLRFSKRRAARVAGKPDDEAVRLLGHLGLADTTFLHRPVTELSVGQQQRVAAARALIGSPELVIADEPTSALDTDNREAFIDLLIQECTRENATLVFVSHDRSLATHFDNTISLGYSPQSPRMPRRSPRTGEGGSSAPEGRLP
jgi:putative ABC transport system ATP-binding protein